MKIRDMRNDKAEHDMKHRPVAPHEMRPHHRRHIPPHERRNMLSIEFDEGDWLVCQKIFGDEDTAGAAIDIIMNAPPEIQILALQTLKMIKEVA